MQHHKFGNDFVDLTSDDPESSQKVDLTLDDDEPSDGHSVHLKNLDTFRRHKTNNMSSLVCAILDLNSKNTKEKLLLAVQDCLELLKSYRGPHVGLKADMIQNNGEHSKAFEQVFFLQEQVYTFVKNYGCLLQRTESNEIAKDLLKTFKDELKKHDITHNSEIDEFDGLSVGPYRKTVRPVPPAREMQEHKIVPDLKTFQKGGNKDLSRLIKKIMQLNEDSSKKLFLQKIEICLNVLISNRIAFAHLHTGSKDEPQLPGLAPHFYTERVRPVSSDSSASVSLIENVFQLSEMAFVFAKELRSHLRAEEDQRGFEFEEFKANANVINAIANDLKETFKKEMKVRDFSIYDRFRFRS